MELGPVSVLVLGCGGLWRCLMMATAALAITSLVDSFCAMPFLGSVAPKMGRLGGLSVSLHCPLSIKCDHNLYCGPLNLSPCLSWSFNERLSILLCFFSLFEDGVSSEQDSCESSVLLFLPQDTCASGFPSHHKGIGFLDQIYDTSPPYPQMTQSNIYQ